MAMLISWLRKNNMKKTIMQHYNTQDALLVITSYPPQGTVYGQSGGGVGSFAKNTLTSLAGYRKGQKIVVLAEMNNGFEVYEEGDILVIRCWRRNTFGLYSQLFRKVKEFDQISQVLVEFEFALYGDFLVAGMFPFFLNRLKLSGRQTIVVVHQVLSDLENLSGHIGLAKNSWKLKILSILMRQYYALISIGSTSLVVLEKEFEKRFVKNGLKASKVYTIEHGVDTHVQTLSKQTARAGLGIDQNEVVFLAFGYLNWYKGSDIAIAGFLRYLEENPSKKARLILAGGQSATQYKKSHYQAFMQKVDDLKDQNKNIVITGFIPEDKVAHYFAASDLVIFPYRTFMSSSGPLSLALSYKKPFIVSSALKRWFGDTIAPKIAIFPPTAQGLSTALREAESNTKQLLTLAKSLRTTRSFDQIGFKYHTLLTSLAVAQNAHLQSEYVAVLE